MSKYICYDEYGNYTINNCMYLGMDGNPVERTKDSHPYSYDAYVVWQEDSAKGKGNCVYSDRLFQWDTEKYNKSCKKVWGNTGQNFGSRSPKDIEKFLSEYYDKEVKLTMIMEGCNVSNGFPYWIFFFENRRFNNE